MSCNKADTGRTRAGFTLIELLVVVAIIALLVSILMPTVTSAKDMAKRAVCASNLNAIGKGASIYTVANDDRYPACTDASGTTATSVGYLRTNGTAAFYYSQTRAWYPLVKDGTIPADSFICPADEGAERASEPDPLYDFPVGSNGNPISYAMQRCLYLRNTDPPAWLWSAHTRGDQVLMADMNGLMMWYTGALPSYCQGRRDGTVAIAAGPGMNSANHGREGQNVLRLNSSVAWETSALCGPDDDNIYTPHNGTTGLGVNFTRTSSPYDETDPFLMP